MPTQTPQKTGHRPSVAQPESAGEAGQPSVWIIVGEKGGDNGQVETLAQGLGWRFERKRIFMRPPYRKRKPRVRASLHHVDIDRSDPLEPPWPEMIVTVGRRLSMVALWVRRQSGGQTKIVLVGKPSGSMRPYDLIVASAENQMPPRDNILPITLPLMRLDEARIARARHVWQDAFASLPRPLVALLLGGPTVPFVYNREMADRTVDAAARILARQGGTVYIATSPRTPDRVVRTIEARLPAGARLYRWQPDDPHNPYLGLLGLADGFVVSGDSISMITEVVRLGRPLVVLEPPVIGLLGPLDHIYRTTCRRLYAPDLGRPSDRRRLAFVRGMFRIGLLSQTRDFRGFYDLLKRLGLAQELEDGFVPPARAVPDDLATVVARIHALAGRTASER